jgi:hypothetical protein
MKGLCKLTRTHGKLIKSHLLPKALTRPEVAGCPFIQSGGGTRPIRRWDSWYDRELVTQVGEDILADLDTKAISILRKHKLVWSSWGPMQRLCASDHQTMVAEVGCGVRRIQGVEGEALRLFFISLLWRAAATNLREFHEVAVHEPDLETLRTMILNQNVHPLSFYPATLIQLSTQGEFHNHAPIAQDKLIPSFDDQPGRKIPVFRFYLDGLVAHIHNHASDDGYTDALGDLIVGANTTLVVTTVTYEQSFQKKNLEVLKIETMEDWPRVTDKLLR